MKLFEFLTNMSSIPEMYLGRPKISLLNAYISGFIKGEEENNVKYWCFNFKLFHEYIAMKYNRGDFWTRGWATILEEEYWDTKQALDKFFEHLEEFKKEFKDKSKQEILDWFQERWYDVSSRLDDMD